MKIGLFGGSFDPVHHGHLWVAQDACTQFGLDRVVLIPAAQAPLRANSVQASAEDRLELLRLVVAGYPTLAVSDYELRQGGTSYTINTVRFFQKEAPGAKLYWIVGGDQLAKLAHWREAAELVRLVEFIVFERPGFTLVEPPELPGLRWQRCPGHYLDISSSEIRANLRQGRSVEGWLPHKAIEYLQEKHLYMPAR